jgi:tetratricopeptide (TPR) repeat protein
MASGEEFEEWEEEAEEREEEEEGRSAWFYLARCYLDLQQLRQAVQHRLRRLRADPDAPKEIVSLLESHYSAIREDERNYRMGIRKLVEGDPLYEWCKNVRGMKAIAALLFLGFIDPYKAVTAGKAKAYTGAIPGSKLRRGERGKVNPELKGRLWFITNCVIMKRDPYYYPLYLRKKQYYLENPRRSFVDGRWIDWPPMKEIIADPKKCPVYEECRRRLEEKARRLGRKPKENPCMAHVDGMARKWLMGLLVSHAAELMRESLGLDTSAFKAHHNYIPPKPIDYAPPRATSSREQKN